MPADKPNRKATARKRRLAEAVQALTALHFGPKQRNETVAYTLLALLDLQPDAPWADAQAPLCGITPIIDFIADAYGNRYAPNTRETIRDDAVKFFVEEGLLLRNPDDPSVRQRLGQRGIKPATLPPEEGIFLRICEFVFNPAFNYGEFAAIRSCPNP